MKRLATPLIACFAACAVPNAKLLVELNDSDATSVCDEYPARTITCEIDGAEDIYVFDCASLDAPAECLATVGDYRACLDAVDALSDEAFCDTVELPDACNPLLDADLSLIHI